VLFHTGATVFTADRAGETIEVFERYRAQLVVMDSHDAANEVNDKRRA
jgi:hypothetical protein